MLTQDQIETLIADSVCINNCIPSGFQLAVLIYLASQIASGGGGGGGLAGTGAPSAAATAGTTYYDISTGDFWVNRDGTATGWDELLSS
jgi:hypothetical protein